MTQHGSFEGIGSHDYAALNDFLYGQMLFRTRKAWRASQEWERRKPDITEHLRNQPGGDTDFNLRKALESNWTLKDLMDAWSWNERDAKLWSANLTGLNAYLSNKMLIAAPLLLPGDLT